MKPIHFIALLLLGAIWGASFLFIGFAVESFGPVMLMFLRVFIAGLILVIVAKVTHRHHQTTVNLNLREKWRNYLVIGLLNSAIPFTLIAFSELKLTVSLAAILNSTTPLFTALIASLWGSEYLTRRKTGGITLGIIGVVVLMGGSPLNLNLEIVIAVIASLLAALSYGSATVYASKHITGLPPIYASIIQLLSATLILNPFATISLPTEFPTRDAVLALSALIVVSTSFAYLLYFYLLREVGPTRTASVTFLVPLFGSIWGVIFLHDPFTAGMGVGMLIIFASISLVTNIQWHKLKLRHMETAGIQQSD